MTWCGPAFDTRMKAKKTAKPEPAATKKSQSGSQRSAAEAAKAVSILIKKYGKRPHPLNYRSPYELLVMVVLSAQTNDALINRIAPRFFEHVPDFAVLARTPEAKLFELLSGVRNFANKARWLKAIAAELASKEIPLSMKELTALPGIGRKSASVLLGELGGQAEGIVVDLHVLRVIPRLGFSNKADATALEKDLMSCLPRKLWGKAGMAVSFLGREVCRPKPLCEACPVRDFCSFAGPEALRP